jgi:outer membrane protein assembly factor BamD
MSREMVYTRGPMLRSRLPLLLLALGTLVTAPTLAGCEKNEPKTALSYTADAKKAYDEAMSEFDSHNWIESQALFREVKRKYSYSKYARLAELRIADADFEQEKFAEAIRGYRQFVHDHRSDADEVSYARSRIAEAQYSQISESFLLPSADERDQAVILDAYKELKSYVHDYPNAKESEKIKKLLADVTARLMRHELYVSRFYLQRDNFEAAVLRIQYALRTFAGGPNLREAQPGESVDSGLEAEALLLLGEVYLKMHKFNDARESFSVLLHDYPRSPLVVQANNYLAYMKERGV